MDEAEQETVTAALEALEGLDELPVTEHLAAFEQAHRELRSALQL